MHAKDRKCMKDIIESVQSKVFKINKTKMSISRSQIHAEIVFRANVRLNKRLIFCFPLKITRTRYMWIFKR